MNDKTLSIIVPSYNVEKYLPEIMPYYLESNCLDDIEIIIINDGSKDHTEIIATEYAKRFPKLIKIISKENGGHGSTINTGKRIAKGKYFKVIDGDDWVDPKGLYKLVESLKEIDDDLVLNPYVSCREDSCIIEGFKNVEFNKTLSFKEIVNSPEVYVMHTITVKTDIVKRIQDISEHCFYVDVEYISFLLPLIQTIRLYDFSVYNYRLGNVGQSVSRQSMWKNRDMHKHVIEVLINFIENQKDYLSEEKVQWLKQRVSQMINEQLMIYLYSDGKCNAYEDYLKFLKQIKKEHKDYLCNIGRRIRMVNICPIIFYNIMRKFNNKRN